MNTHFSKPDLFPKDVGILTFFTLFFHFGLQSLVFVCPVNQDPSYTWNIKSSMLTEKCLESSQSLLLGKSGFRLFALYSLVVNNWCSTKTTMTRFEVVATNTQMKSTLDRRNLAMDSTLDSLPVLKVRFPEVEYMRPIPTATKGSKARDFSLGGSRDPGPRILPFPRGLIISQKINSYSHPRRAEPCTRR